MIAVAVPWPVVLGWLASIILSLLAGLGLRLRGLLARDASPEDDDEPLVGDDYPEGWTVAQERAWQALCEQVDADQEFQEYRDEAGRSDPGSASG